MVSQY
jgi:hypothetical protein